MAAKLHEKVNRYLASKNVKIESTENNLISVFDYLWNDNQVHKILNIDSEEQQISSKNEQKSTHFKSEGNRFYQEKNFTKALLSYNFAILTAPLKSHENVLAFSFANRSAVLYELGQYEFAIEDIDRAIKYGYPNDKRDKLTERKVKCSNKVEEISKSKTDKKKLETIPKGKKDSTLLYRGLETSPITKLIKDCKGSSFLSNALTKATSRDKGRHLIAARDIKPGSQ